MRFYITMRLNSAETQAIYNGFEWAHLCFSELKDEPRRVLFGSEDDVIHPGIPFMPLSVLDDVGFGAHPKAQAIAKRERAKYINNYDDKGGGVYPIGVLHMAHLYLRLVYVKVKDIVDSGDLVEPWYVPPGASDFMKKLTVSDEATLKAAISILENASQAWAIFKDIGNEQNPGQPS